MTDTYSGSDFAGTVNLVPGIPDGFQKDRMREAGLRRLIMAGAWEAVLSDHILKQLGKVRHRLVGRPNTSQNILKQLAVRLATGYDSAPTIGHAEADDRAKMDAALDQCRFWGQRQTSSQMTNAINESLLAFDWLRSDPADPKSPGRLSCRIVDVDRVFTLPMPEDPTKPGRLYESVRQLVRTEGSNKTMEATWHVWDVRPNSEALPGDPDEPPEPERPYFRVLTGDRKRDITDQFVNPDEWSGAAFPWRDESKRPVLPYTLYHLLAGSTNWSPWRNSEVVFATVQHALNLTNIDHASMRASWAVRGIIGGKLTGTVGTGSKDGKTTSVMTIPDDPTGIKYVRSDGDSTPSTFEFGSPVDTEKAMRVAERQAAAMAVHFGLSAADITIDSKGPQSGVAISISRAGQRKMAASLIPQYRIGDTESFRIVSAILRAFDPTNAPVEGGYSIDYGSIELSAQERQDELAAIEPEIEIGLMTRTEARMRLHRGETEGEAFAAVARAAVAGALEAAGATPEGLIIMLDVSRGVLTKEQAEEFLMQIGTAPEPPPVVDVPPLPPEEPDGDEPDDEG